MQLSTEIELLTNKQLHDRVIEDAVLNARKFVWIGTANLKDMHIRRGKRYKPILDLFEQMAQKGVSFRIVHSDMPSKPFQKTLDRFNLLISGALELQICPRCHWKMVIVDGSFAYLGSANFTGAGLGVKSEKKRNLEIGITSEDPEFVASLIEIFDSFWIGTFCRNCVFRKTCPDPIRNE
ncbi:phospholipase D-like domain-containing protein [Thermodesulfobacteriota bacterium]